MIRMQEKIEISPEKREVITRIAVIALIIAIALLSIDVFTTGSDGRRQIIDNDGATETALTEILQDIKGAGDINIMIRYNDEKEVSGVIVTSSGAGNSIVRNNLTNAVSAVFDIPVSNVMVFEKEYKGESINE